MEEIPRPSCQCPREKTARKVLNKQQQKNRRKTPNLLKVAAAELL